MQSKGLVSAKINGFLALREHKAFSLESVAQTQEKKREFDPTNEFYVTCPNQCQPAPFESAGTTVQSPKRQFMSGTNVDETSKKTFNLNDVTKI